MELSKEFLFDLQKSTALLVQDVGNYVYEEWLKEHTVSFKDFRDVATEVDVEAERRLRNGLQKLYSDAGFIVEEGEDARKDSFNWIIDPLDQTKKYVAKLPLFFVQIGLLDKDGECILGHIYNPVSKQLFSASKDNGAYLNDKKFITETRDEFSKAIVDINFSGKTDLPWKLEKLSLLAEKFYRIQISSNAFSAYILTGAVDCFVALADLKDPVDILPRVIIMKEAGLQTEYLEIEGRKLWIVAAPKLFDETLALLMK